MPQKVLRFTGINRKLNEFQSTGACEELINLRPGVSGGLAIVKQKQVTNTNSQYTKVYEHSFGDTYNQIVVSDEGYVMWLKHDGVQLITSDFAGKGVSISSAENVLVIYCDEDKKQSVYKFEDGTYGIYDIIFRRITDVKIEMDFSAAKNTATSDDSSVGALNRALNSAASSFYAKYPSGLCGASVIGCTYELNDGNEVWSTAFIVANSNRSYKCPDPEIEVTTNKQKMATVYGAREVEVRIDFEKSIKPKGIKRINVYASKPAFQFTVDDDRNVSKKNLDDIDLSGQIMYYQGSINPNTLAGFLTLNFSKEQFGEKVMDVDAGCIERVGETISYNNRFHCFRSIVNHILQPIAINQVGPVYTSEITVSTWIAYVMINDKWILTDTKYRIIDGEMLDIIYPMSEIKRVAFVKGTEDDYGNVSCEYKEMFEVKLKNSTAYNYSYAFDVTPNIVPADDFYNTVASDNQLLGEVKNFKAFLRKEINTINVSAAYNPYVFPVEYSYGFGGEIKDLTTSYLPISSSQVGQYPITVFTSAGIFALEQGDRSTLYSNIVPLQPMEIKGKACATPYGTFFISSKGLYVLSGRDSVNVSYVLNGERELNLRDNPAYKKLCHNGGGVFFDFSNVLSSEDFEAFVDDASLTYDQLNNEVIISSNNPDVMYSYVFNLDTKSYHKVSKTISSTRSGARYVIETIGNTRNIVDMHTEEHCEQPILLQSRPLSLEALYTHIQRMMLLVDAKLEGSQNLCLSIFASDNLYDWKCIISSQKQNTVLRQIRTNRAAKSYKDYIILISGTVDTNTDISDLIADYTVVNRRLG